jgi:hypothetical protein
MKYSGILVCSRRGLFLTGWKWCTSRLILSLMVCTLSIHSSEGFPDHPRPTTFIGYTEGRIDLPDGQFANWVTNRACLARADGAGRRVLGEELIQKSELVDSVRRVVARWKASRDSESLGEPRECGVGTREQDVSHDGRLVGRYVSARPGDREAHESHGHRPCQYLQHGIVLSARRKRLRIHAVDQRCFQTVCDGSRWTANKRDVSGQGSGFTYGYSASPDGKRISYHENYQIYVSNVDGSDKRHIETGNPFNFAPQWSPDGEWLLFVSGEHYNCHPHVVKKDGTELRKLADRGGYRGVVEVLKHPDFHSASSDLPVWSRDGNSIYYTAKVGESIELMQVDLTGSFRQLTHSSPATRHYHPSVSPDGQWILFGSDRSGTMQLYVAGSDGADAQPITNVAEGYCAMHGHWQPVKPDRRSERKQTIVTVAKSTAETTRKSEGDSMELADGRLLLVYMEFSGDGSDFARTRLVAKESSDGGLSWNHHRVVTETTAGDMNVYSPNLIRAQDGGILLMFMRQHRSGSLTNHVWQSTDEGQTFMPFSEFVAKQNFSLCNATVKRLKSGRLLLPASPPAPGKSAETGPYVATVLMSDDDGLTWTVSQSRVQLPMRGAMEPHVEQTGDGRVLMVMRNQLGRLYLSESIDDGATWSEALPTELTSPESCPELTRIPGTDHLLMIWNNTYDAKFRSHYGKRSPLTAAISKDHGKTWRHVQNIESDPTRAFSNPGCRFTRDGRAIINYWTCEYLPDWRMQDVIDLRVAIIDREWFYHTD